MKRPVIIAVSGFSSEVEKPLMCDLLRAFPEWEAIKVTRGHYRSCGRDPHACLGMTCTALMDQLPILAA